MPYGFCGGCERHRCYFSKKQWRIGVCRMCSSTCPANHIMKLRVAKFLKISDLTLFFAKDIASIIVTYSGHVKIYTVSSKKQRELDSVYRAIENIGRWVNLCKNSLLMKKVLAVRTITHWYKEHKNGQLKAAVERRSLFIHNHRVGKNEDEKGQGSCAVCWYRLVKRTTFTRGLWHCNNKVTTMTTMHLCDEHIRCDMYRCSFWGCTNVAPKKGFCCCHVDDSDRSIPMPDIYGKKTPIKCSFGESSKSLPGESCNTMTVHGYCIDHWKVHDLRQWGLFKEVHQHTKKVIWPFRQKIVNST